MLINNYAFLQIYRHENLPISPLNRASGQPANLQYAAAHSSSKLLGLDWASLSSVKSVLETKASSGDCMHA